MSKVKKITDDKKLDGTKPNIQNKTDISNSSNYTEYLNQIEKQLDPLKRIEFRDFRQRIYGSPQEDSFLAETLLQANYCELRTL